MHSMHLVHCQSQTRLPVGMKALWASCMCIQIPPPVEATVHLYRTKCALPQGFPSYLQQYDMGYRALDSPQGQPSYASSVQTGAGAAAQQPGFGLQVCTCGFAHVDGPACLPAKLICPSPSMSSASLYFIRVMRNNPCVSS